ncbi:MAG: cytochrome bc complex cytochrome b subunit [Frankiaceae bacterium]|jgi:ubiquinol-cytochrome c reductase cytochrome b subunit|nr:cytochrome bc complex cytochrome b subunit [Frankiaceae bacterium]
MTDTIPARATRRAPATRIGKAGVWIDERLSPSKGLRTQLNKVFPDHWSFMMGEIAMYAFAILITTGTYLTFFFDPSMTEVTYNGTYAPLRGIEMTRAYESALNLSFDVRGGLIIRQIHHWAALLFVAAMMVHMFRVYFTGAYRKPREINWLIGLGLITLGLVEGFSGYSLPDDLLSGTGLRIAQAIALSIPVIGTWLSFLIFGDKFPGTEILGRLYIVHVLLVPAILAALIGAHLALVIKQKHTQFPGHGRTETTVIGERMYPVYGAKAGGFFFIVFGFCALLGGIGQINPIWLYGPYTPSQVSAGSQPDFYIAFLDGSTRLFPSWEIRLFSHTIPPLIWPCLVLPGIMFTLAGLFPFIESKLTGDRAHHNLLQRPRDAPVRTGLGAMAIAFYMVLLVSGGNDLVAHTFDISLNAMTWAGRIGMLVLPPIAYWVTYRVCLGLQRHDREVLGHGIETGIIRRLPSGAFIEVHQPLGPLDDHGHSTLQYAGSPVPKKMNKLGQPGRKLLGFFKPLRESAELERQLEAAAQADRAPEEISR